MLTILKTPTAAINTLTFCWLPTLHSSIHLSSHACLLTLCYSIHNPRMPAFPACDALLQYTACMHCALLLFPSYNVLSITRALAAPISHPLEPTLITLSIITLALNNLLRQLPLPLPRLGCFCDLLPVLVHGISHRHHTLVPHSQQC